MITLRCPDLTDDDGFRRVARSGGAPLYPNAVNITAMRAALEPRGSSPARVTGNVMPAAIDDLKTQARRLTWRLVPFCEPEAAFALAAGPSDSQDPADRILAMVCRAHAVASAYAARHTIRLADQTTAMRAQDVVERALQEMVGEHEGGDYRTQFLKGTGPLQDGLDAIGRHREWGECEDDAVARRNEVADAIRRLAVIVDLLNGPAKAVSMTGSPEDKSRLVFVMRLAEVFSLATTEVIYFAAPIEPRKRLSDEWRRFLVSALVVSGLGDGEIDSLLRRLKDADHLDMIRSAVRDRTSYFDIVDFRPCLSTGHLIDHGVGNPSAWGW